MKGKVLVAGIGNIFMGDDAFGVEVVKRLKERTFPDYVEVIDFGIRSYDLAYALMEEWDLTILIDALPLGGAPGTLYTMEAELPNNSETDANLDAHTMNPVAVLQLVSALGGRTGRILVVGCEPGKVEISSEGDIGLTLPVRRAVDEAAKMVEQLIARAPHTVLAA
jgi:hydrogenase maturation protease